MKIQIMKSAVYECLEKRQLKMPGTVVGTWDITEGRKKRFLLWRSLHIK